MGYSSNVTLVARNDIHANFNSMDAEEVAPVNVHVNGDAESSQQRLQEEELDRIRTEGDLALVHAQAERQLIAAVDEELRQLQKQLKEKKKQLSRLTGASASNVVGDAVALEQISRRHARAQQELEERLKSALSSKVLELQKLRIEIDETRKRRVDLLQSERNIIEEIHASEESMKQCQCEVEAQKKQACALRADILRLEDEFDQEKQAFRLERQQLQLELDRIARPERVAVKVNVLGRKFNVYHNISTTRKKREERALAKKRSLEQRALSFEQKKRLLDRIVKESGVPNLNAFIDMYNKQEREKAEVMARIQAKSMMNASLNDAISQLEEDITRMSGAGDIQSIVHMEQPTELKRQLEADDSQINQWTSESHAYIDALRAFREPIRELYVELFPEERDNEAFDSTVNEISMLRRIGAIEERVMQHVLSRIAKDIEASGQSETLRRLQKYRGAQKQRTANGSPLVPMPVLPSIRAADEDPATADDEIDAPVVAVHASSCRPKRGASPKHNPLQPNDSDSLLNELLQHPRVKKAKTSATAAASASALHSPASSVKSEPMEDTAPSTPQRVQRLKKEAFASTATATTTTTTLSSPFRTPPRRARNIDDSPQTATTPLTSGGGASSARPRKRRNALREDTMKPLTPTSTVQSSMNASLVFDMVTTLSTNDPGVAIATLRSIVVLGKEYPSNLLYDELVDRILSTDAVAYADAVSIYASLVFVFDKAATCSCDLAFPYQWEPFANALQDVVVQPKGELWRRKLLVVQFYVYCFQKDWQICRERYRHSEPSGWTHRTRLFTLLRQPDATSGSGKRNALASKAKVQNNLILQAIGCALSLWQRVFDEDSKPLRGSAPDSDGTTKSSIETASLEAEDACMALVRLIEMLYLCSDQVQNILQRLQAGLTDVSRATRVKFSQAVQLPDLRVRLATTMMGLTNKSRSKENEWYECNAIGRFLIGLGGDSLAASSDVMVTDGYSWSHYDTFKNSTPRNGFTRLLQEIVRVENETQKH